MISSIVNPRFGLRVLVDGMLDSWILCERSNTGGGTAFVGFDFELGNFKAASVAADVCDCM